MGKRLLYLSVAVVILLGLGFFAYSVREWWHITTVPFKFNPNLPYPLVVETRIDDQPASLALDFHYDESDFVQSLRQRLGITTQHSIADVQIGRYHCQPQIEAEFDTPIYPSVQSGISGRLGSDFFAAHKVRLTLDFVARTLTIDDWSDRARLIPPPGTIQVPLHHYYPISDWFVNATLKVGNQSGQAGMNLDTEDNKVWVDDSFVRLMIANQKTSTTHFTSQKQKEHVLEAFVYGVHRLPIPAQWYQGRPVALQLGTSSIATKAYVQSVPLCSIGLSVLSQFRVVLDYRDRMLYLEPPNS
jgi:hypothetical protein